MFIIGIMLINVFLIAATVTLKVADLQEWVKMIIDYAAFRYVLVLSKKLKYFT